MNPLVFAAMNLTTQTPELKQRNRQSIVRGEGLVVPEAVVGFLEVFALFFHSLFVCIRNPSKNSRTNALFCCFLSIRRKQARLGHCDFEG